MKPTVFIPSAKLAPIQLQAEFGAISSAMIPLDGRPALRYVMDQYPEAKFVVATHEAGEDIEEYCKSKIETKNVQVIGVGPSNSLGKTILTGLLALDELPDQLVINFADTAVPQVKTGIDAIYFSALEDVYRWTTFTIDNSGNLDSISEKQTKKKEGMTNAFVGVFCFSDVARLRSLLQEHVQQETEIDPFYEALRSYYNVLPPSRRHLISVSEWHDFGHLDTYYESRKRLSAVCRHFNSIEVDDIRGTITKRSRNAEKFIGEIQWYLKLPKLLQYIAPRVFDYNLSETDPSVNLEFYGYPVLNDLYLYGQLDLGAWARIFSSIDRVLCDMAQFKPPSENPQSIHRAMRTVYESKTLQRIDAFIGLEEFSWARAKEPEVNGEIVRSLPEIATQLPKLLSKAGIYEDDQLCIIHGDFCFSNILYDRRNGIIRTIDPRGSFGEFDIYGDPRYDISKLSHSIEGDYDLLLNGFFDLDTKRKGIHYKPHLTNLQLEIKELYQQRMLKQWGEKQYQDVRLLMGLLFISMVPLHSDRPRSQQAFLANGMVILTEMMEKFDL